MGPPNLGLPRMSQIPQDTQYSQISEFPHREFRDIYQSGCPRYSLTWNVLGILEFLAFRSQLQITIRSIFRVYNYYLILRIYLFNTTLLHGTKSLLLFVSHNNSKFGKYEVRESPFKISQEVKINTLVHAFTNRIYVESLVSSNPLSSTTINTSNSITQTAPGRQRLLWVFPLQPCFNHS